MFNNPNMTDVNGAGGAMDEDGELDAQDSGEVNEAPEEGLDNDTHGLDEDDASPLLQGLSMRITHPPGMQRPMVELVANIHTDKGITSKRRMLAGVVTVQKLISMLHDVANW